MRTLASHCRIGRPTPVALREDLSAQIVFRYLNEREWRVEADAVSNNHFDEDGLVSVYSVLNPEAAQNQKDLLIDIAAAGDFATYRFRNAARTTFVLSAFADADISPLDPGIFKQPYPGMAALLYQELLRQLPEMVHGLDRYSAYWKPEDETLSASERMIRNGKIQIDEDPALDLAVVTLPESLPGSKIHRFTQFRQAACHPMAVHNAVRSFRILLVQGRTYQFQYRYESWVQYVSRRVLPRIDLTPLAAQLSDLESGRGRWIFEGVEQITPKLGLTGAEESQIAPEEFVKRVKAFLASGVANVS
jgi:hypothetical protein